MLLTLKGDM